MSDFPTPEVRTKTLEDGTVVRLPPAYGSAGLLYTDDEIKDMREADKAEDLACFERELINVAVEAYTALDADGNYGRFVLGDALYEKFGQAVKRLIEERGKG